MKFHGEIQDGKLLFPAWQWRLRNRHLRSLEGKKVVDDIREDHKPKTSQQMGYYHAVVLPTVHKQLVADGHEVMGVPISEDMTDKILKHQCAQFDWGKIMNKRDMSVKHASHFLDNCIRWANDMLNCRIPEPNGAEAKSVEGVQ
ncbi:MAG: hypothetical protein AMJ75_00215 [Phycisphaerae bacterium SM1_79]|nr:MAG: hypothetical protein AMJ75_00215 [Phycisphaerae bacterium SM1_79]